MSTQSDEEKVEAIIIYANKKKILLTPQNQNLKQEIKVLQEEYQTLQEEKIQIFTYSTKLRNLLRKAHQNKQKIINHYELKMKELVQIHNAQVIELIEELTDLKTQNQYLKKLSSSKIFVDLTKNIPLFEKNIINNNENNKYKINGTLPK